MKKLLSIMMLFVLVLSFTACSGGATDKEAESTTGKDAEPAAEEVAETPKDGYVIGFSNSFNGNTYRQTMEAEFKMLADELISEGVLSDYKILESNNNVATQISQIESLIIEGVDAIIVDPGSASGLNGAIEKAEDAGIPVIIINDGPVTTDACYEINFDTEQMATNAMTYLAEALNGEGKIINIRGMAGVPFDETFNSALQTVVDKYPGIEIVGEVYGEWTASVAQQQIASILPGLEQVDGVIGQGGDGYGAVQAFESSEMDLPIIIGGNRGNFLNWWVEKKAATGYETYSWAANPWNSAAAIYVAVDLIEGNEDVPRVMTMPSLEITQDMVDDYADLPDDFVAVGLYDHAWVIENLYQ